MANITPVDPQATEQLPALAPGMPPSMALWFDDAIFERAKQIATYLSKAEGFVPQHLVGKPEACFAVVERALTWKLSPYAVAQCTYQTPGGKVGFEGKLCQAILENSGKVAGGVKFTHFGDWSKVQGKFAIKKSDRGKDYAVPTWTREDAKGLGVVVSAQVKGEVDPREWSFDLEQAFPLNSTLWATDPKSQICYTAVRRFGNLAAPGLFMGVPFDREDFGDTEAMRDVTPRRPQRSDFGSGDAPAAASAKVAQDVEPEPATFDLCNIVGEIEQRALSGHDFADAVCKAFASCTALRDLRQIEENNRETIAGLPDDLRRAIAGEFDRMAAKLEKPAGRKAADKPAADKAPTFTLLNRAGKPVERDLDAGAFGIELGKLFDAAEFKADVEALYQKNGEPVRDLPEGIRNEVVAAYDQALVRFGQG